MNNERRPNDVFTKNGVVVHRCILEHGDADERWHWEAFKDEALRARESEEAKSATLRAIGERLLSAGGTRDGTSLESFNVVLRGKEAIIKALADALWDARQYGDDAGSLCWCQSPCGPDFVHGRRPECEAKEAALRSVGRLP